MRSYLKETIRPLIPSNVRSAIKEVTKYSQIYNVSGSVVNNVTSTEDVWIPSAREVNFANVETEGPTYSMAFPDNASRVKNYSGSAYRWWLRSAHSDTNFKRVETDGSISYYAANYSAGVALGFCL